MGVSRDAVVGNLLYLFNFKFSVEKGQDGQEVYVGTDPNHIAEVRYYGPKDNINQATMLITLPQPPPQDQYTRALQDLVSFMVPLSSGWGNASQWVLQAMQQVGTPSTTQFGDRVASMLVTQQDGQDKIAFTIRGK